MAVRTQKRLREEWQEPSVEPCPQFRMGPLDGAFKKIRHDEGFSNPQQRFCNNRVQESVFNQPSQEDPMEKTETNDGQMLLGYLPKGKKKANKANNNNSVNNEVYFTQEQVKEIVSQAVRQRELTLRQEYDQILQEKLAEQFRSFTQFNQDYISRQFKDNEFSYLS